MATIIKNEYGDTIVTSNGTNNLPDGFDLKQDKIIILKGYTIKPSDSVFLCNSNKYGELYCSEFTKKNFPKVKDGNIYGGCCVTFIEKNDKLFTVLVKAHDHAHITNPCGMTDFGETPKQSAARECLEETGLVVENLQPLGFWTFNCKYGGLNWLSRTTSFYGYAKCPENWNLDNDINKINFSDTNNEIDYILIVDVNSLDKIDFNGHHCQLVKEAVDRKNKKNILNKKIYFKYLKSFKFIY